ncbi:helix-turn-helix domain-containing protein [Chelativorans salis]|uniref:AraC family transcriptional regulator n=1 Tax=Chelativorans salis TaxID=2978478 RepID=A0ABT2LKU2_9HYPH|nr:AraC family transcriptional regulator [Chelativorans sp. EGI FJ00035]MCT7375143.1 AraC family transcriptional regulator [Chelativorans sp. EGI FJ00035]
MGSDKAKTFDAEAGTVVVNPANMESKVEWLSSRENTVVAIEPDCLLDLAAQELNGGDVEIRPTMGTIDPAALHMAELLKAEMTRGEPPNELYIDSLIVLFGIYILRHHSSAAKRPAPAKGGLSNHAARMVQEYLDEHFARKLSVAELANVCKLSPGHFIPAFSQTFGQPPHRYLVDRRLAFASKLLLETKMTIAEVAYLSGFSSQSHLTSAMKKYKRITPARMRMMS